MSTVAEKLIYLRENNALKIEDVASKTGVNVEVLNALEAGKQNPGSDKIIEKLATYYQVPVSYITSKSIEDDKSYDFLTRAMERISKNDHDEIVKFAEFLKFNPRKK